MLPVASGEGSLVAMPEAPPARAHRVNAQAPTRSATTFSAARRSRADLDADHPPLGGSSISSRMIVGGWVEHDPLGERDDLRRS